MRFVVIPCLLLIGCVSNQTEMVDVIRQHQDQTFTEEQEDRARDMMSVDAVLGVEGNHANNQSSK